MKGSTSLRWGFSFLSQCSLMGSRFLCYEVDLVKQNSCLHLTKGKKRKLAK